MIILAALLFLSVIGIIIHRQSSIECSDFVGVLCIALGLCLFVIVTTTFIIHYYECNIEILAFEETRLIYERASANGDNIIAAFRVVESNRWLRKQQY